MQRIFHPFELKFAFNTYKLQKQTHRDVILNFVKLYSILIFLFTKLV